MTGMLSGLMAGVQGSLRSDLGDVGLGATASRVDRRALEGSLASAAVSSQQPCLNVPRDSPVASGPRIVGSGVPLNTGPIAGDITVPQGEWLPQGSVFQGRPSKSWTETSLSWV